MRSPDCAFLPPQADSDWRDDGARRITRRARVHEFAPRPRRLPATTRNRATTSCTGQSTASTATSTRRRTTSTRSRSGCCVRNPGRRGLVGTAVGQATPSRREAAGARGGRPGPPDAGPAAASDHQAAGRSHRPLPGRPGREGPAGGPRVIRGLELSDRRTQRAEHRRRLRRRDPHRKPSTRCRRRPPCSTSRR